MSSESTALSCTFCHKSEKEVFALLAFPDRLNICDECVWLMVEIVATDRPDWRDKIIDKLKSVRPEQT